MENFEQAVRRAEALARRRKALFDQHIRRTEKIVGTIDPTVASDAITTYRQGSPPAVAIWTRANVRWFNISRSLDQIERRIWQRAFAQ